MILADIMIRRTLYCLALLFAGTNNTFAQGKLTALPMIPETLQREIVEQYSSGHCDEVRTTVEKLDLERLRPNVLAIVAYCSPSGHDPEDLFSSAEKKEPTGDLILTLHAFWRVKTKGLDSARPVWEKLFVLARNDYFRTMAHSFLAGAGNPEMVNTPLDLSPNTEFARIFLGAFRRSDPRPSDFLYLTSHESYGTRTNADLSWRRWYGFGSVSANYSIAYDRILTDRRFDLVNNTLEAPVEFRVSRAKDLAIRPYVTYATFGGEAYNSRYGLGVKGTVYRENFVQWIQTSIYTETEFIPEIVDQGGTHYRFDYAWDVYPSAWYLSSRFFMDHNAANRTLMYLGRSGDFEMSYTRFGLNFIVRRDIGRFTVGFEPTVEYRQNTTESTYIDRSLILTHKKRQDFTLRGLIDVSMPLTQQLQLYAWYERLNVQSTLGKSDYVNRNVNTETIGLGIRTSIATY